MKIALIDFGSFWGQAWHSFGDSEIGEAHDRVVRDIRQLAERYDRLAICLDSPPYRRAQLYPPYKAHREKLSDLHHEQRRRTIETLRGDGYCLLACDGEEADDVVASAVAALKAPDLEITVWSSDKDLAALWDPPRVKVHSILKREELDPMAKWGIPADKVTDALAMAGDKSDNVPGIEGVGAGRAATLIKAGLDVEGLVRLVEERAEHVAEGVAHDPGDEEIAEAVAPRLPPKMGAKIALSITAAVNSGALLNARDLVQLRRDIPIDTAAIFGGRKPAEAPPPSDEGWDDEPESEPPPSAPVVDAIPEPPLPAKPTTSTAMVVAPKDWTRALEPRGLGTAWKLATKLSEARLFTDFGSPSKVLAMVLSGRELGLGVMASLRGHCIVKGKPAMYAQLMMALCLRHPDCEYFRPVFKDCTNERARVICKRKSWPEGDEWTWTIEEARAAGLMGNAGWQNYPKNMLIWRCVANAARMFFPDILAGVYTPEELSDGGLMP
jgi:5'-3' exonuclease